MAGPKKPLEPRYLGDGVYVHDKGWALELAVDHHNNKVIVLEDTVIKAFLEYAKEAKYIEL